MKRIVRLKLVVPTLVAAVSACWISGRWSVWFHNAPEPPFETRFRQERPMLLPGEDTQTQRVLTWRCDTAVRESCVLLQECGRSAVRTVRAEARLQECEAGRAVWYRCLLDSLTPGRSYRYRLSNDTLRSGWRDFRMPAAGDSLSFVFVGDIQDTDSATVRFGDIAGRCPDAAFWLFCGDMAERPAERYWSCWFEAMQGVAGAVPVVSVPGNHEYLKGFPPRLEERWLCMFVYPDNGPGGEDEHSFFLDYPGLRLVAVDTQGINTPADLLRHCLWLDRVLGEASGMWKVAVMHHPLHSPKQGRDNPLLRWAFVPILRRHGVHLVLQGHDHIYSRRADKPGRSPVYVTSSCSVKHYRAGHSGGFDRVSEGERLWQRIVVTRDTLRFASFRVADGEACDRFVVTKSGRQTER